MRISDWSSDVCSSDLDKPEVQEADLVIGLARCMLKTQQYEQAAKLFSQVQDKLPKPPEILVGLASCRRHKGALGEAEKLVRQVLAASPDRSEESRVGKERVRTCRSRWSPAH